MGKQRQGRLQARLGLALVSFAIVLPQGAPAVAQPSSQVTIGDIPVHACKTVSLPKRRSWCGSITRPWGTTTGTLKVGFTVITPAGTDLASIKGPPIVAMEGGPGYNSIDSAQAFAEMLGPVLDDRVLLVMDARGTGRSAAIDCPSMGVDGNGSVAACGRYLGQRIAAYSSAAAADDLAALITGLGLGPPLVYGDSYGTYLAQVYAGRHPVAGLVLDGAFPISGEDAWFGTQGPTLRKALDLVCSRSPNCDPGRTVDRLSAVLSLVREQPRRVRAPGADNRVHGVVIDGPALVGVAYNGTYLTPTLRELDAALGAALADDWLPLGRLVAEGDYPGGEWEPAAVYSSGQYLAVSCHDYPQLFNYAASMADRRAQVRDAIADRQRQDSQIYAPFTIREYLASEWAEQEACVTWPLRRIDPTLKPAPSSSLPNVPVLVISGDLDTITTAAEGQMVADAFPQAKHLIVGNGLHVNALGSPDGCAASAVRAFMSDPAGFAIETECALPPIQLAPAFAPTRGEIPVGQAVAHTVADILDRAWQTMGYKGRGLRGGRWSLRGWPQATITLDGVRLYQDLPLDGTIRWNASTGEVIAHVRADDRTWSGCWQSQDGLGPEASASEGADCLIDSPTLSP